MFFVLCLFAVPLDANHALLAELAGKWNYVLKMSVGPDRIVETTGVVVRKPIMDGRFMVADFSVEKLPRAGGRLEKVNFHGRSIEGYDDAKKKFVTVWIDNQSNGFTIFEGTYDAASHSFTYETENAREVITVLDPRHYRLEWFQQQNGQMTRTIEINYTRM